MERKKSLNIAALSDMVVNGLVQDRALLPCYLDYFRTRRHSGANRSLIG